MAQKEKKTIDSIEKRDQNYWEITEPFEWIKGKVQMMQIERSSFPFSDKTLLFKSIHKNDFIWAKYFHLLADQNSLFYLRNNFNFGNDKNYLPSFLQHQYETLKDGAEKKIAKFKSREISYIIRFYLNHLKEELQTLKYVVHNIYVNFDSYSAIYITDEKNVVDDNFISIFYNKAFNIQDEFREGTGMNLEVSFIENENLLEEELLFDNFSKLN